MSIGVRVEGLTGVVKGLQRAGVEVADLKAVFAPIAAEGADMARSFAPKRTGKLAASARGNKAKNKAVVTVGRARVPYAGAINYGWPARGIKGSFFMQRIDDKITPLAVRMLDDGLGKLLEDVNAS